MPLALFGIEDGSLNLAVNLLILVLVVFWLSLVYWTWADARRRISDPVLITTATVLSLVVPFIGTVDLHDPAAAGVPRRRSRARDRDPGLRAAGCAT